MRSVLSKLATHTTQTQNTQKNARNTQTPLRPGQWKAIKTPITKVWPTSPSAGSWAAFCKYIPTLNFQRCIYRRWACTLIVSMLSMRDMCQCANNGGWSLHNANEIMQNTPERVLGQLISIILINLKKTGKNNFCMALRHEHLHKRLYFNAEIFGKPKTPYHPLQRYRRLRAMVHAIGMSVNSIMRRRDIDHTLTVSIHDMYPVLVCRGLNFLW